MAKYSIMKRYYPTDEIIVALDIGTTKIVALAGVLNDMGRVEVLGYGKVQSEGVMRGVVANIDKTAMAIADAIDMAEKRANHEFRKVYVGIAGQHIKSIHHRGVKVRDNMEEEISRDEIRRMVEDMYKLALPPGEKILHVVPQEFTIDDEEGIVDPVGMCGSKIEGNFHVITGKISAANNIMRCLKKAGLELEEMVLEPIGSATAVLSEKEVEAGVVMVDIGGGTTDLTIFYDGIIRHTAVIPFGGNVITRDIAQGCNVIFDQAEKLKVKFGRALAENVKDNRIIIIPGIKGRQSREISEKNLALIIQARMEEIFELVAWEIKRSGYEGKLIGGMVLTGGGALLQDIELLANLETGLMARIGRPNEYLSSPQNEELASPIFSTGIGILRYALLRRREERQYSESSMPAFENATVHTEGEGHSQKPLSGWLNKSMEWMKKFFEASHDSDL